MRINQKQLLVELSAGEPIFKKEAEKVIRQYYFNPAVQEMQDEFNKHKVTTEIEGGIDAGNESNTLVQSEYDHMNLYSFIGFGEEDSPIEPIRERLDPNNRDGPKISYVDMDRNRLSFRYRVSAPNEDAIYRNTPMPWAPGLSWAKRIEVGIAGLGKFLNTDKRKNSRSGGGIQVENTLRKGVSFRNTSYLSKIFNDFLNRFR